MIEEMDNDVINKYVELKDILEMCGAHPYEILFEFVKELGYESAIYSAVSNKMYAWIEVSENEDIHYDVDTAFKVIALKSGLVFRYLSNSLCVFEVGEE